MATHNIHFYSEVVSAVHISAWTCIISFTVMAIGAGVPPASPEFTRTARALFTRPLPSSPAIEKPEQPRLHDNLGSAYSALRSGKYLRAIVVGPFVTILPIIETAARKGTHIVVLTTSTTAERLSQRLPHELLLSHIVLRQSPAGKQLHDKAILLQQKNGLWEGYFGSANPSYNQFRSNELVTKLANLQDDSGKLIAHIQRLARISKSPSVSRRPPGQGRTQMRETMQQLCIRHNTPSGYRQTKSLFGTSPVSELLRHIRPEEPCTYKISSMTLNHPAVAPVLKAALEHGSVIQLLLDRSSAQTSLKDPKSTLSQLVVMRQSYPEAFFVRVATGRGKTGIHHAKGLLRHCPDDDIAVQTTGNLTTQAAGQTNYSLTFPAWPPPNQRLIDAQTKQFDTWWNSANPVEIDMPQRTAKRPKHVR